MPKHQSEADMGTGHAEDMHPGQTGEAPPETEAGCSSDTVANVATIGVICVGAALFEAALIPGMIIGVAAMLAPKALPRLGAAVEPAFRGTVRGAYKFGQKARHAVAEAQEQMRDIVAEERAGAPGA